MVRWECPEHFFDRLERDGLGGPAPRALKAHWLTALVDKIVATHVHVDHRLRQCVTHVR